MKKLIALLLAMVLCLSFAACSEEIEEQPGESGTETTEEQKITLALEEVDGLTVIPQSEFSKCLEVVTLTKDNWQDYFKVMTVFRDAYGEDGEIVDSYEKCILGVEGKYYHLADFEMTLRVVSNGSEYKYDTKPAFFEKVEMEDLECLSVSGTMILMDIPFDAISLHPDTYSGVFYVGTENPKAFHIIDSVYIDGDDLGEFWK